MSNLLSPNPKYHSIIIIIITRVMIKLKLKEEKN